MDEEPSLSSPCGVASAGLIDVRNDLGVFELVRGVSGEQGAVGKCTSKCPVGWINEGGGIMDDCEDEPFREGDLFQQHQS